MVKSLARTVKEYLETLPPERRGPIATVREVILEGLPDGYVESMNWGMISYEIPLSRYPNTHNQQPLMVAALASQKNEMTVYLMCVYGDPASERWFKERYKASGKKLNMGKSCVHFKKLDDLPLDLIGEAVARVSVDDYIRYYEKSREKTAAKKRASGK